MASGGARSTVVASSSASKQGRETVEVEFVIFPPRHGIGTCWPLPKMRR